MDKKVINLNDYKEEKNKQLTILLNHIMKQYKKNLIYFRKLIDNKYIIISFKNGNFYGTITEMPKEKIYAIYVIILE